MRLIDKVNKFSRRSLSEEDVYIFSVVLCDNEIDRDGDRFSDSALETLKNLFIGRTGVFDHVSSTTNLTARIFDTELVTDSRTTKYGSSYKYLKASAYMVRTAENKNLIAEIDGSIKKEVSISCSAVKRICSICGCNKNKGNCSHKKGKNYGGKQCYIIIDDITDAYEWSFVGVPVQQKEETEMFEIKHGMQKVLKNDLRQCINSFENVKNGGVGIADEIVCQTCKRALEYIDTFDFIDNAPTIEAEPVRHGKWFGTVCSACGESTSFYYDCTFCPNCDAKMDGGNV